MTRPARALELPSWSVWRTGSLSDLLTIGIEEEFMLLDPHDWSLAYRSADVMSCLPYDLRGRVTLETHAAVMEIATGVHRRVATRPPSSRPLHDRPAVRRPRMGCAPPSRARVRWRWASETVLWSHPRYRHIGGS